VYEFFKYKAYTTEPFENAGNLTVRECIGRHDLARHITPKLIRHLRSGTVAAEYEKDYKEDRTQARYEILKAMRSRDVTLRELSELCNDIFKFQQEP